MNPHRSRRSLVTKAAHTLVALAALTTSACVDPAGRLDDFFEASEPFRLSVVIGPCQGRVDITGDFLLSIATVIKPISPILFDATFVIDKGAEPWTIDVTMTALAVEGRAPVGDPLRATSTVDADGTFDLDFGEVTIGGAANAILPGVDAIATLTLSGCTNGIGFSCGTVDGGIVSPATLPLIGSTYGAVGVDGDLATAEPMAQCPE